MSTAIQIDEARGFIMPGAVPLADIKIRRAAGTLGQQEARYLVDLYYMMQEYRKASGNQVGALVESGERHEMLTWSMNTFLAIEKSIKGSLLSYASAHRPGAWAMSIHGIGPVIAAGLLAHIQIEPWHCTHAWETKDLCSADEPHGSPCGVRRTSTAGQVWRFAGLDPTVTWEKGKRRPWNARLKRLAWIIGDSFVKHRNNPKDFYGQIYEQRKAQEIAKNAAGDFAAQAARSLADRKISDRKLKKTYEDGRLPDGRIDLRARRYATKLFLAHYHHVAFESHFGEPPPKPYVIEHLGHAHYVGPPGWTL